MRAQRYGVDGNPLGTATVFSAGFDGSQSRPSVAPLDGGGFVVVWLRTVALRMARAEAYGQRFDASGARMGDEFRVALSDGVDASPSVSSLSNGFVVVLTSYEGDDPNGGVFAQRYDAQAQPVGAGFCPTSAASGEDPVERDARVATLSGGGFVVTWIAESGTGAVSEQVVAQRYTDEAEPADVAFLVAGAGGEKNDVLIGSLSDGGFVIGWTSTDATSSTLAFQRYEGRGIGRGKRIEVARAAILEAPAVAGLETEGFAFAWSQGTSVERLDLVSRRYNATGKPESDAEYVNDVRQGAQISPSIAARSGDTYLVAWTSRGRVNEVGSTTYARILDPDAVDPSEPFLVNVERVGNQEHAAVAGLSGGGFVVVWDSAPNFDEQSEVVAQRFGADGRSVGEAFVVNTFRAGRQAKPVVSGLVGGGFVVVWDSYHQQGQRAAVYAQRFDASGARVGVETPVSSITGSDQVVSSVTGLSDGGFVVGWTDRRSDLDQQAWVRRFDASGTAVGSGLRVSSSNESTLDPSVTALGDGFGVAWTAWTVVGVSRTFSDIYARTYGAPSATPGAPFRIARIFRADQNHASAATLVDGRMVVTWADQQAGQARVLGGLFDAFGNPSGDLFQITAPAASPIFSVATASLAGGEFVASWTVNEGGAGTTQHAQRVRPSGEPFGERSGLSTGGVDLGGNIAALTDGRFVAVTSSFRGADGQDVFAQVFLGGVRTPVASQTRVQQATLGLAAPNPSRGRVRIGYELNAPGAVRLVVYDVMGREVAVLVDGMRPAGSHNATWDASGLSAGVYVYQLEVAGAAHTRTMTVLR